MSLTRSVWLAVLASLTALQAVADGAGLTRLARLTNAAGDETCFALVVQAQRGIPRRVLPLGEISPDLCQRGGETVSPDLVARALSVAAEVKLPTSRETVAIGDSELSRVRAPVTAPAAAARVIGVGLNYAGHREETGSRHTSEPLLFPKPTPPWAAYDPLDAAPATWHDAGAGEVRLLDYEVEIGMYLLAPVDLSALPPDRDTLLSHVAFFTANDVSDRVPIIMDDTHGYTAGKSLPGFLRVGPWLVPGSELRLLGEAGTTAVGLELSILHTDGSRTTVQRSTSTKMLWGPWPILQHLAALHERGENPCMMDRAGRRHRLLPEDGVLRAGTIILTGTPAGTALRKPSWLTRARLFLRGGLTLDGARMAFIREQSAASDAQGYLQAGDVVETWVENLGRQRWAVTASAGQPSRLRFRRFACP